MRKPKPDPEIYRLAAQRLGVAEANCIVFEDSKSGVQAARDAGMRIVGILTTEDNLPYVNICANNFLSENLRAWLAAQQMRVLKGLALLLVALAASRSGLAQTALTLGELNARTPRDYGAVHARQEVSIRGTVNALPFHFPEYTVLTIQDGTSGAALHTPSTSTLLDALLPGDVVEASGSVITLAGMVMVDVGSIKKVLRAAGFQAATASIEDLQQFKALGRLARVKGHLIGRGSTTAGPYLMIGSDKDLYRIFFPVRDERLYPALPAMAPGDEIETVGVAFQYAAGRPPYNRGYELLATEPPVVAPAASGWWWSPLVVLATMLVVAAVVLLMGARERRLRRQRELLRRTYQLGEEIFGAASIGQIQKRLDDALPAVLGVTRVRLYRYNRSAKQLDAVSAASGEPGTISLSAPTDGPHAGAVACFHYRSLLAIPDVSRSPFPVAAGEGQPSPKSLLFVPMIAQGEVVGVLELDQDDRVRDFSAAEQSLGQHLGNQVGVALRMLDQRSVQEQLSRTEKLAAVGRLISSIVNELEAPLASIQELADQARERVRQAPGEREVAAIEVEAQKAASVVARLVTFASSEQVEARPVAVGDLLRRLIDFREGDWKASGIRVHDLVFREPLKVLGSHGQLEQVFLNLLVHAEQALADAPGEDADYSHQRSRQAAAGGGFVFGAGRVAQQCGGDRGRARAHAKRGGRPWRRSATDREERRRAALRGGTAAGAARTLHGRPRQADPRTLRGA